MPSLAQFIWAAGGKAQVADVCQQVVRQVGDEVLAETVRDCPVDTGTLAGSYTVVDESQGSDAAVYVGTSITYAPFVELGTRRMAAQPHLGPALERARRRYG